MNRDQFILRVRAVQSDLRRFLAALCCGDTQEADDLAQEAFIKAYMSIDSLADPQKFRAWIMKIAYRIFLDHRRSICDLVGYEAAVAQRADDRADSGFDYQALYVALEKLSPKERGSIVLYYMEGYAVKEIAEMTGANESAVKKHLSRGRLHLRSLLETEENLH